MTPTTLEPDTKAHPQPLSDPTWDERLKQYLLGLANPNIPPPTDAELATVREHYRLQALFPNQWVVFRDVWDDPLGDNPTVARREVYFVSPDQEAAQEFLRPIMEEGPYELTFVDY